MVPDHGGQSPGLAHWIEVEQDHSKTFVGLFSMHVRDMDHHPDLVN
jgi:hypothetical protein